LLLFAAGQVEGEDDLGDDGVGVGGVGGGRGGGGLPGAGDDRGALHEPHRAVGPRRLQVLGFLAHRVVPPPRRDPRSATARPSLFLRGQDWEAGRAAALGLGLGARRPI